jgi:hypothetical protein
VEVMMDLTTWGSVGSLLTGVFTPPLAFGVIIAIWQLHQMRQSTNAQIAVDLFKQLRDKEVLDLIRKIYKLPHEEITKTKMIDNNDFDSLLDKLDMLASLVNNGIVDKTIAIETYGGPPFLKCWYILYEYIDAVRDRRGGRFCQNTETFAINIFKYYLCKEKKYKNQNYWPKYYDIVSSQSIPMNKLLTIRKRELLPIRTLNNPPPNSN